MSIGGEFVEWGDCEVDKSLDKQQRSFQFNCPLEDFYIQSVGRLHFDFVKMNGFFRYKNIRPNGEVISTRYIFHTCAPID